MLYVFFSKVESVLPVSLLSATCVAYAESVDQYQTAQNVQSDLGSKLPDMVFIIIQHH
jgi:hypothetical membrane protein